MVKKDAAGSESSKKELKKEDTKKAKKKSSASSNSKKQRSKEDSNEEKISKVEVVEKDIKDQEMIANPSTSAEDRKKIAAKNFSVTVSFSLYNKLLSQAEEEGISLDEYAGELLSEGCVVRAWDIQSLNYNSSFKGSNGVNGGGYRPNSNMSNGSNFRMNKKSKKGMSHARYQNIMNDKSAFMEYVRRSDKEKRR